MKQLNTRASDINFSSNFDKIHHDRMNHNLRESANPYFKLDLKNKVKVQRVEVLSRDSESLIGSKVHIGNRGMCSISRFNSLITNVEGNKFILRSDAPLLKKSNC